MATRTSCAAGGASVSVRISPHPGAVTQKDWASVVVTDFSWAKYQRSQQPCHMGPLTVLRCSAAVHLSVAWLALIACALPLESAHPASFSVLQSMLALACLTVVTWWFLPAHLPHQQFGAANAVTLLRAVLTSGLAGMLGGQTADWAWVIIAVATIILLLDGIDGYLARKLSIESAFGSRFDMETDAALILILSCTVWLSGKAGPWIILSGLLRYGFVAAALYWPWLQQSLPPSKRRQTVCVLQIISLLVCLCPWLAAKQSPWLAGLSLLLLAASFTKDIIWLKINKKQMIIQ